MLSLPIPEPSEHEGAGTPYASLQAGDGLSYLDVVRQLGYRRPDERRGAHVDPDLVRSARPRLPGWKPIFGQSHAAQKHLDNEGVGVGDLFLFFGLFRRAERVGGSLRWVTGSPKVQAIFGYLQVGEKLAVDSATVKRIPWAADHPHLRDPDRAGNTVYVAADRLSLGNGIAGAGTLCWCVAVALSAPGSTASVWSLPSCFGPPDEKVLTYHGDARRWERNADGSWRVQAVGRGQEFVIQADAALQDWAGSLIARSVRAEE